MIENHPSNDLASVRDRALGCFVGLFVGDALGTTLEFSPRDTYEPLTDMVGGGPFNLEPGQWTDDSSMALCLAESLLAHDGLDERDLMGRFCRWWRDGDNSVTGRCFDIGITVAQALAWFELDGNPIAGSTDAMTAGNGSLMRLAPVMVRYWNDSATMRDVARRQSETTHRATEAVDACEAFSVIVGAAIQGKPLGMILSEPEGTFTGTVQAIISGSWRDKTRDDIRSTGYVNHSLEAALWCVGTTGSFEEAVLKAANLGNDADTTAAIAGSLAGAVYGFSGIPERWRDRLAWRERIEGIGSELLERSLAESVTGTVTGTIR